MIIWISRLILLLALSFMIPRIGWNHVLEGQITKQSFVAHMISSFYRHQTFNGFPLRFFVEPWHDGVIPWAEEFPLYHVLSSTLAHGLKLDPLISARMVSFLFFLLLLVSIFRIFKKIHSGSSYLPWLAVALFSWFPGVQIYGTSVMPDMAMLSMIALALELRLQGRKGWTYLALMFAALFKYFAVFAILAFFIFDLLENPKKTERWKSFGRAAFAALPTLVYLLYVIVKKVPNPVIEYRENGYGHLAGPFLFKPEFYARFFLWVFVKNSTLVLSLVSIYGVYVDGKKKEGRLFFLLFLCYTLFAFIFASSFYVHDYYALPFMIPVLYFAVRGLLRMPYQIAVSAVAVFLGVSFFESRSKVVRQEHYQVAGKRVEEVLSFIPDSSQQDLCVFVTDISQPPIPVLSKKSGWSFVADRFTEMKEFYLKRLSDEKTRAVVFYFQKVDPESRKAWEAPMIQWNQLTEESVGGNQLVIYRR